MYGLLKLLPLLALPLWAADDADTILKRVVLAQAVNAKRAEQYTYVKETQRFRFDKSGVPHPTASETHEIIFVEGIEYQKLVARNGKALSAREQAQVERDMRQTAEDRRKHDRHFMPGGAVTLHGLFTHRSADLGSLSELLTFFDNRVTGEEEIRGHKVWVIECAPQDRLPASEHEREILGFRKKLWVDQAENVLVRALYTIIAEGSFLRPGSSMTFDYEKVDAETWQTVSLSLDFSSLKEKVYRQTGRTLYSMRQFQKFNVESTITVVR